MIKRYCKKPITIEAIQWTGDNLEEVEKFTKNSPTGRTVLPHPYNEECLLIVTLEGEMRADKNDYIIKGVQGEFYPCKPDIFEATYEEV